MANYMYAGTTHWVVRWNRQSKVLRVLPILYVLQAEAETLYYINMCVCRGRGEWGRENERDRQTDRQRVTHLPKKVDKDIFSFLSPFTNNNTPNEKQPCSILKQSTVSAVLSTRAVPQHLRNDHAAQTSSHWECPEVSEALRTFTTIHYRLIIWHHTPVFLLCNVCRFLELAQPQYDYNVTWTISWSRSSHAIGHSPTRAPPRCADSAKSAKGLGYGLVCVN